MRQQGFEYGFKSQKDKLVFQFKVSAPIAILLLAILLALKYYPDRFYPDTYRMTFAKKVFTKPENYLATSKSLILGDSTAQFNINTNILNNSTSLAVPHAPILLSYFQLRRIFELGYGPGLVIIGNSYDWMAHLGDDFWRFIVGTDLISLPELNEIVSEEGLNVAPHFGRFSEQFLFLARAIFHKSGLSLIRFENLQYALRNLGDPQVRRNRAIVARGKGYVPKYGKADQSSVNNQLYQIKVRFEANPTEDIFIEKLGKLARSRGTRIVFVFFPYSDKIDSDNFKIFMETRKAHLAPILKSSGFEVVDLELEWPDQFFYDFTHLNHLGSKILTEKLRERLFSDGSYQ